MSEQAGQRRSQNRTFPRNSDQNQTNLSTMIILNSNCQVDISASFKSADASCTTIEDILKNSGFPVQRISNPKQDENSCQWTFHLADRNGKLTLSYAIYIFLCSCEWPTDEKESIDCLLSRLWPENETNSSKSWFEKLYSSIMDRCRTRSNHWKRLLQLHWYTNRALSVRIPWSLYAFGTVSIDRM